MPDLAVEPLAVWDCGQPEWWDNREAKTAWLNTHGLPANSMYRAEFYANPARVKVFCYALNGDGRKYQVHAPEQCTPEAHGSQCIASEEPRVIPLPGLPPPELR